MDDDALAQKIGVHRTTISRAKRGLRELGMDLQLKLQKVTGIPPAEWADFYAQTIHLRGKAAARAQKKSAEAA
ncbi:MAG: helix-turn-helix domain-containing protein [Hyphomonadaceae bacterium]